MQKHYEIASKQNVWHDFRAVLTNDESAFINIGILKWQLAFVIWMDNQIIYYGILINLFYVFALKLLFKSLAPAQNWEMLRY